LLARKTNCKFAKSADLFSQIFVALLAAKVKEIHGQNAFPSTGGWIFPRYYCCPGGALAPHLIPFLGLLFRSLFLAFPLLFHFYAFFVIGLFL